MNALYLIVIVLLVFIMGYRFYAKFLLLGVFRTENDVPTPRSSAWGLARFQSL